MEEGDMSSMCILGGAELPDIPIEKLQKCNSNLMNFNIPQETEVGFQKRKEVSKSPFPKKPIYSSRVCFSGISKPYFLEFLNQNKKGRTLLTNKCNH